MPGKKLQIDISKLPKRRCKYCNALFPLTKRKRVFCCDEHRAAFHHQGAAYGPLSEKIDRFIERAMVRVIEEQLSAVWTEIENLKQRPLLFLPASMDPSNPAPRRDPPA